MKLKIMFIYVICLLGFGMTSIAQVAKDKKICGTVSIERDWRSEFKVVDVHLYYNSLEWVLDPRPHINKFFQQWVPKTPRLVEYSPSGALEQLKASHGQQKCVMTRYGHTSQEMGGEEILIIDYVM